MDGGDERLTLPWHEWLDREYLRVPEHHYFVLDRPSPYRAKKQQAIQRFVHRIKYRGRVSLSDLPDTPVSASAVPPAASSTTSSSANATRTTPTTPPLVPKSRQSSITINTTTTGVTTTNTTTTSPNQLSGNKTDQPTAAEEEPMLEDEEELVKRIQALKAEKHRYFLSFKQLINHSKQQQQQQQSQQQQQQQQRLAGSVNPPTARQTTQPVSASQRERANIISGSKSSAK